MTAPTPALPKTLATWGPWVGAALLLVALVIGGKCYGNARATAAVGLERAHLIDSVATRLELQFNVRADSAQGALARATITANLAKAAAVAAAKVGLDASRRADIALARADGLRDSLAHASPAIQAAFDSLETALDASVRAIAIDSAAMRAQAFAIDSLSEGSRKLLSALSAARITISEKDLALSAYKSVKTPTHGLLYQIGRVAETVVVIGAAGTGGYVVGHLAR